MDQYIVNDIPGIDNQIKSYAGHIKVETSQLFFWYFPHETKKIVVWLNGGPGCSSMTGVFFENGPYRFTESSINTNTYAWTNHVGMLYLDQPAGTGYSMGPLKETVKEASLDFKNLSYGCSAGFAFMSSKYAFQTALDGKSFLNVVL